MLLRFLRFAILIQCQFHATLSNVDMKFPPKLWGQRGALDSPNIEFFLTVEEFVQTTKAPAQQEAMPKSFSGKQKSNLKSFRLLF
jgi:hypothetical protein